MPKALLFHNFSKQDFTAYWDRAPITVKAGEKTLLEDWLANHVAKHFADQVLNEKNVRTSDPILRKQVLEKCLIDPNIETASKTQLDIAMMNAKLEKEAPAKNGKRKKAPDEGSSGKNPIGSEPEETFEGLES